MNAFGYLMGRLAWNFGIKRQKQRWQTASRELHFLKEAEDLLGQAAWKDAENVEELSSEYWQIRSIENQQKSLSDRIDATEDRTDELYDLIDTATVQIDAGIGKQHVKKVELSGQIDEILLDLDEIKDGASIKKKKFEGLKLKLKILKDEGAASDKLEAVRADMQVIKDSFSEDKDRNLEKTEELKALEEEMENLDEKIGENKKKAAAKTLDLNTEVSQNSKKLAEYTAKLGSLDREKRQLQAHVGNWLSAHAESSPNVRDLTRKYSDLVNRINYFRRSIRYNQRLAKGE